MTDSPYIFDINEQNFEQIILQGSLQQPVLVDFWAGWCQPCQILMPMLAKLANEYQGRFILAKVDTEAQQAIAAHFGIRNLPTVKLFKQGQVADEFSGALPEAEIRAFLDKHLAKASDDFNSQLEALLQAGDMEAADKLASQAYAKDPASVPAILGYTRCKAILGDLDNAEKALATLAPDEQKKADALALKAQLLFAGISASAPDSEELQQTLAASADDAQALYQIAAHAVNLGQYEQALELLLKIMQKHKGWQDDAAHKAILAVFDLLGDDPLVKRYRMRLFNLLH